MSRTVTVEQVLSWRPCEPYRRGRIEALFAGRQELSALEILALDIPAEHRLWAVLREDLIAAETLHEFACRCAESVLYSERAAGREPDLSCWAAIEAKRKWLRGEITDRELRTVEAASWRAAGAAAVGAAEATVEHVAAVAGWRVVEAAAAPRYAAEVVERHVAVLAVKRAARAATMAEQVERLREMLIAAAGEHQP